MIDDNKKEPEDIEEPVINIPRISKVRKKVNRPQVCKAIHDDKGEAIRHAWDNTGESTTLWLG